MRGRKSPPLDLTAPVAHGPVTFEALAHGYLQDYVLQQYRTLNTARPRVAHLRDVLRRMGRRRDHGRCGAGIPITPPRPARRGGHHQPRDLGAQPDVPAGHPARPARSHAAVPEPAGRKSAPAGFLRARGVPAGAGGTAPALSGRAGLRVLLGVATQRGARAGLGRGGSPAVVSFACRPRGRRRGSVACCPSRRRCAPYWIVGRAGVLAATPGCLRATACRSGSGGRPSEMPAGAPRCRIV